MSDNKIYILSTCDEWKSYSSFALVGATKDFSKLLRAIGNLIDSGDAELTDSRFILDPDNYITVEELNNSIRYIFISEVEDGDF